MDKVYREKKQCYGCSACANICPVLAIRMEYDEEGFSYPVIDPQKCIDCKMCVKICPFHQTLDEDALKSDYQQRYFATQHKDQEIVARSSSGGMFTALSDCILAHNGVVYGAAFDAAFVVGHQRAEDKTGTGAFRGSKYIQSDIKNIYFLILEDISQGRQVLFTGTPCQVAGVRSFVMQKKHSLDNLILCDFICHGVASPRVWTSYIDYFKQKYDGGLSYYEFRGKTHGWHEREPILRINNNDISNLYNKKNSFLLLYQTCFADRPCCYSCKYTSYNRYSDMTLADFWNIGSVCPEMDDDTGTSQVLVNTQIGQKWFDLCLDEIKYHECSKKDVWQPHLEYPTNVSSSKREKFWAAYHTLPFETVLKQYGQGDIITKCKNFAIPIAKKLGFYVLAGKLYRYIFIRKESNEHDEATSSNTKN